MKRDQPRRQRDGRSGTLPKCRTARQLAFAVLREHRQSGVFVGKLLETHCTRTSNEIVSDQDRRLASELVFGIVRRRMTLNVLIELFVRRPRHEVENDLWLLLQLGVYQSTFLSTIPPHATVNETVELAKWLKKPHWSGFVNGVLRSVTSSLTDVRVSEPSSDAIPLNEGTFRRMGRTVFPDPQTTPCRYVAQAFSFPLWLVQRWFSRFVFDDLLRLGFWFNAHPAFCLRPNVLRTNHEELTELLAAQCVATHVPITAPFSNSSRKRTDCAAPIWLENNMRRITDLSGYETGLFTVQDASAMRAAALLAPRPGDSVLDLCAAPGTKTTHLAELMKNRGHILATDVKADRLAKVNANCDRLGVDIVTTRLIVPDGSDVPAGPFDAVLVDVPCSNTGVLGKRPEARWRVNAKHLHELTVLQSQLLCTAVSRLKPGGRLVYSTCSIEPEENQERIQECLARCPTIKLLEEHESLPGQPSDGGYVALLVRD